MNIRELLDGIIITSLSYNVAGVSCDSRKIKKDFIFVCISKKAEIHIDTAISNGAKLIIVGHSIIKHCKCNVIVHSDILALYIRLMFKFYNIQHPRFIAAVTGTNGKTSTVDFTRQLWYLLKCKSSSIGTLGNFINNDLISTNELTTPDIENLNFIIKNLGQDIEYLCLEASSHGIEQQRIYGLNIQSAAFTNISHDHLDYHGNFDYYFRSKQKLFTEFLLKDGYVILNRDISEYDILYNIAKNNSFQIITYGMNDMSDVKLLSNVILKNGYEVKIQAYGKIYESFFPVLGRFQLSNLLCAIGIVLSSGIDFVDLPMDKLFSPKGRLEKVSDNVIVDYAHTPDALKNTLVSVKNHTKKKIILVFGCGGDRDKKKRISMAKIADQHSDLVIISDDNPRNENPSDIRKEIIMNCNKAIEIPNRYDAIRHAINISLKNKSIVIVAGKGHEETQIIGNTTIEFSDTKIVQQILSDISQN